MARAFLPFYCVPTPAVTAVLGSNLQRVALAALQAALRHGKSLEIAHLQITYGGHDLAFSTRVTAAGDLVLDIDIGDARLRDRIVLEDDLRRAHREVRGIRRETSQRGTRR